MATLRTSKGLYKRSITRLVPLLEQEQATASLAPEDVQVSTYKQLINIFCHFLLISLSSREGIFLFELVLFTSVRQFSFVASQSV